MSDTRLIELDQVYYTERKMERASRQVDVVLSGTMSHVIVSDVRKAPFEKGRGEDVN